MSFLGDELLSLINFLSFPTWHLVALYIIILLIIAWRMIKGWGF